MKLLSNHQIGNVLETRLLDYKVSCKTSGNNLISLVLTHVYTGAVYGISGIRPSDYRGPYGATILAKKLMEAIETCCNECSPRLGKVISIVQFRPDDRPARQNITVLTLLAGQRAT
ncbi:MAG TPA: hypothetical protein VF682_07045 [Pseudomonas sp.]|jgi:hypothetical protein